MTLYPRRIPAPVRFLTFWALAIAVAAVMGAATIAEPESPPTWVEHWDVAKTIIALLFGLAVWFSAQKLNRIDKKFDLFFDWKDKTERRITVLETEHKLRTGHDCRPKVGGE